MLTLLLSGNTITLFPFYYVDILALSSNSILPLFLSVATH